MASSSHLNHLIKTVQCSNTKLTSSTFSEPSEAWTRPYPKSETKEVLSKCYDSDVISFGEDSENNEDKNIPIIDDKEMKLKVSGKTISTIKLQSESWIDIDDMHLDYEDNIPSNYKAIMPIVKPEQKTIQSNEINKIEKKQNASKYKSESNLENMYLALKEERKRMIRNRKTSSCGCL